MMSKTKAPHDLLNRFRAPQHDTRTGGELTVRTNPQPSKLVKMPDPYSPQAVVTSLCETIHAMQVQQRELMQRIAEMEQRKPVPLVTPTTTRNAMEQSAPAWLTINVTAPRTHPNVRPCPMVQARAGNTPDPSPYGNGDKCPLASGHNGGYGAW